MGFEGEVSRPKQPGKRPTRILLLPRPRQLRSRPEKRYISQAADTSGRSTRATAKVLGNIVKSIYLVLAHPQNPSTLGTG